MQQNYSYSLIINIKSHSLPWLKCYAAPLFYYYTAIISSKCVCIVSKIAVEKTLITVKNNNALFFNSHQIGSVSACQPCTVTVLYYSLFL